MRSKDKAIAKLKAEVISTKELIDVSPHSGKFNFRCYENAVEFARLNEGCKVVEVIYIDGSHPILHYVNQTTEGEYLETTLGYQSELLTYYKIREIHPDLHLSIQDVFRDALEYWSEKHLNWWLRLLGTTRLL